MSKLGELRKLNNRDEAKISNKNKEKYDSMILYLRGSKINEYHQELIRQDPISMILGAEERGESLKRVFNGDYKATLDEIIASAPVQDTKERFIYNLSMLFFVAFVLLGVIFVMKTIAQFRDNEPLRYVLLLGDLITFLITGFASVVVLNALTSGVVFSKNQSQKNNIILWVVLAVTFGVVYLIRQYTPRIVLIDSSIVVGIIIIGIIGALYKLIDKYYTDKYHTEL
ncbi:hypothetical protein [Microaceticoccus formicicus]|uniref:hypothetical protein n=1 Tax=Microaceticoccus formicicus TaxID=3118105 RepID=UPI003CD03D7B|nr:hypothetical protein VZL98_02140 [Peptoniphilaceae bacterium AMB_02]